MAPQQVISHTLQIRLGPLAILFSVSKVFDEVLPDGAVDRFNFLVELTDGPDLSLGVVLLSVVLPYRVIDPVVVGEGKCGHHGLKFHWSCVHHGFIVVQITCVSGSSSITSVGSLIVVNQLPFFDCSTLLVLFASLSAEIFRGNSISYQWWRRERLPRIPVLPICRFGVHSSLSLPLAGWSLTKPHLGCTWLIFFIVENCLRHRMCCMFQLPKGWRVSSGSCCTCRSWGRSLLDASRPLLLCRRPGVDSFFQVCINEFGKFVAEHLQVGLRIRRAVMLQSIYVHGVKGLEAVDQDSLRALPSPTVVGRDFVHQFVQLAFDLPRSSPVQCKLLD
jgi:hypothetical protein